MNKRATKFDTPALRLAKMVGKVLASDFNKSGLTFEFALEEWKRILPDLVQEYESRHGVSFPKYSLLKNMLFPTPRRRARRDLIGAQLCLLPSAKAIVRTRKAILMSDLQELATEDESKEVRPDVHAYVLPYYHGPVQETTEYHKLGISERPDQRIFQIRDFLKKKRCTAAESFVAIIRVPGVTKSELEKLETEACDLARKKGKLDFGREHFKISETDAIMIWGQVLIDHETETIDVNTWRPKQ